MGDFPSIRVTIEVCADSFNLVNPHDGKILLFNVICKFWQVEFLPEFFDPCNLVWILKAQPIEKHLCGEINASYCAVLAHIAKLSSVNGYVSFAVVQPWVAEKVRIRVDFLKHFRIGIIPPKQNLCIIAGHARVKTFKHKNIAFFWLWWCKDLFGIGFYNAAHFYAKLFVICTRIFLCGNQLCQSSRLANLGDNILFCLYGVRNGLEVLDIA